MKTAYRIVGTFICAVGALLLVFGVVAKANAAYIISALAFCCGISFFTIGDDPGSEQTGGGRKSRWSGNFAYIYSEVEICGFGDKLPNFDTISMGGNLQLVPEPENEYDCNAIALYGEHGFIGYMHQDRLQRVVNDFNERGIAIQAKIIKLNREAQTLLIELQAPHKIGS